MKSSMLIESENPKLTPEQYIEKYKIDTLLLESLNTIVSKKCKKPETYMIKYLCSLLSKEEKEKYGIKDCSKENVDKIPIVSFPNYFQNEIIKNNLTQNFWETKKYVKSTNFNNIMDIFDKSKDDKNDLGITLSDSNCLEQYKDFLEPLFIEHFKILLNDKKSYLFSEKNETISFDILKQVFENNLIKFFRFELKRNLKSYSENLKYLNKNQAEAMIEEVYKAVLKLNIGKNGNFDCVLLKNGEKEFENILSEYRIDIDDSGKIENLISLIKIEDVVILLNHDSNLRIFVYSKLQNEDNNITILNDKYKKIQAFADELEKYLHFDFKNNYGYINKNPNNLGISAGFYTEINCPYLTSDSDFFIELKNNLILKTQNQFEKFGRMELLGQDSFFFEINSILGQCENDFLEDIINKLYNLDFLYQYKLSNQKNWELEKLDFQNLKCETNKNIILHENFRLERTYDKVFPYYKYIELPNNINLNTLIYQIINNNVSMKAFSLFRMFFENLFTNLNNNNSINSNNFKNLKIPSVDEPIINSLNYNPFSYPFSSEEYRVNKTLYLDDSFTKKFLKIFDLNVNNSKINQCIKELTLKVHRNFQNYDFPNYLSDTEKLEVSSKISEALECRLDKIEIVNQNLKIDKEFKIHINTSDHFVLEFSTDFKNKEAIDNILNFVKSFRQICLQLEFKKNYFSIINNLGYRLNDLSLSALGFELDIELNLEVLDEKILDREWSLFKNKYPVSYLNISKDEKRQSIKITNDKKYENYFNYLSLQNLLDKFLEFIGNLKIKEPQIEKNEELFRVNSTINIENLNISNENSSKINIEKGNFNLNSENMNCSNNINPNDLPEYDKYGHSGFFRESYNAENNLSYEGSSIHLNDSKISDKGEYDKSKTNFEISAVHVTSMGENKHFNQDDNDDIQIE